MTPALAGAYGPQVPTYGVVDAAYGDRLGSSQDEGPIYMLSLMKYRTESDVPRGWGFGVIGRAEGERFAPPIPLLTAVGALLCFVADVVASTGDWDRVAVVGYPARRSFLDLASREEFRAWRARKGASLERTTVLGTLPVWDLPREASSRRVVLEIWDGPEPARVADGDICEFNVEGTVIGDGRPWSGARYTAIDAGTPLPLQPLRPDYQALLLQPRIERWV